MCLDDSRIGLVHHATADVRIQTIMLAWAFIIFLEGLSGFGLPWAIVVPILVGLGIDDLDAIRVAALGNYATSFGSLGVPILALAAMTGFPLMALSASIANAIAIFALLPPWILLYLVSGWEGMIEAWPLGILGSLAFIAGFWPVTHFLGPYLADPIGGLACFWVLFFFVKIWRPKTIRGFGGAALVPGETSPTSNLSELNSPKEALTVWVPYIVLFAVVVSWTGPWSHLPLISWFKLLVAATSSVTQKLIPSVFNFAPFGAGTSILVSWLVIMAILRPGAQIIKQVFSKTLKQMWGAILVAFFIFALAYIFVFTGMANSLAYGFSKVGLFFLVLAPILGWIGCLISGSVTGTNAMFGPVQLVAGRLMNLPVLLLPSINSLGAEAGKSVAPQTASMGVSTSKLVRSEGQVIRHNMGWTLVMLAYVIVITLVIYFFFPKSWMSL